MSKVLNKLFNYEDISLNEDRSYMHRWGLFSSYFSKRYLRGRNVYLHCMVGDDWSRDMHDHPKKFWSIGIAGCYVEETPYKTTTYRAPWFRSFPPEHVHRLRLGSKRVWSLVYTGPIERDWGFWVLKEVFKDKQFKDWGWYQNRKKIYWKDYVEGKRYE